MAKRLKLGFEIAGFEELIHKLDKLNSNAKDIVADVLENAAEDVATYTKEAMAKQYLPAKGKYSDGDTEKSIVAEPKTIWVGSIAEVGVGFDYGKPGAGGFLITGTPRMRPNYKLEDIYARKKFRNKIIKQIGDDLTEAIQVAMEGKK